MNSASLRTPGIFERWGCQLSAATPFSEQTQTPSGVFTTSDWLPSVWPGRPCERDTDAQLDVPVEQHEVVLDDVVHPARHVPRPLHRVRRPEGVDLLALAEELGVREERAARLVLALHRPRGAHEQAHVLDVEVVEGDEVDVGGGEPATASASSTVWYSVAKHVAGEPLAIAVDQLRVERRLLDPSGTVGSQHSVLSSPSKSRNCTTTSRFTMFT